MDRVEEGVANFKKFQLDNREFIGWSKRQEELRVEVDARRSRIHFWLLGLLSALIVALFAFMLSHFEGRSISLFTPSAIRQQQAPQDASMPKQP